MEIFGNLGDFLLITTGEPNVLQKMMQHAVYRYSYRNAVYAQHINIPTCKPVYGNVRQMYKQLEKAENLSFL